MEQQILHEILHELKELQAGQQKLASDSYGQVPFSSIVAAMVVFCGIYML